MVKILSTFNGSMDVNSKGASVYSYWVYFLNLSLLPGYANEFKFALFDNNYRFYEKLVIDVARNG